MFWNAFVWGLGVSCGGGIGIVGLWITLHALQWATGRADQISSIRNFNERSLAALVRRNELTSQANESLSEIAVSLVCHLEEHDLETSVTN